MKGRERRTEWVCLCRLWENKREKDIVGMCRICESKRDGQNGCA